jgi:hypothetical protein
MTDYQDDEGGQPQVPVDPNREKIRGIVERIQVGDTDEGTEALQELIEHTRASDRATMGQSLRQELAAMRMQQENEAALGKFAKRYSNLAKDPVLAEAGLHVLRDKMVDDLKGAGVTEEMIAPVRGDTNRLAAAHALARGQGLNVRSAEKLLDDTGQELSKRFGIRPTQRSPEEYVKSLRAERGLPDREGRGGEQSQTTDPATPRTSDDFGSLEARRARVRAMRESRGFPVNR